MSRRVLGWMCVLLWFGLALGTGHAQSTRGDLVLIKGRLHADLGLWGARNGLRGSWNPTSGELRFSNRWINLLFKADTARLTSPWGV